MDKISFKNNVIPNQTNQTPEIQQRMQSQENFGAVDREKLKQDTVELANKTKAGAKENFIFRGLKNFGVEDPKKFLVSCGLTLATIVGFATLGKKSLKTMTNAGINIDEKLANSNIYKKIGGFFADTKSKIGNFFKKSDTIKEASDILSDKTKRVKPKIQLAKGMGQGFSPQFAFAVKDMAEASSIKAQGETFVQLKKLIGKKNAIEILNEIGKDETAGLDLLKGLVGDEAKAGKLFKEITDNNAKFKKSLEDLLGKDGAEKFFGNFVGFKQASDPIEFVDELTETIAKNFNVDLNDKKAFQELLEGIKEGSYKGKDLSVFKEITMDREGLIGGWWPANIAEKAGKKLGLFKEKGFGRGNLGEGLWRYNVSKGKMAKTGLGKLAQNSLLIPGESISNFVCDNAGMNLFLVSTIISLYNNMQDAPKGKKAAVVADDFIGTIGSMAIATPLAFKTTYGLASLSKLEGNGLLKTPLKWIGKFFNMGLGENAGKLAKVGGGALRFVSIMFVFSSLFRKPIDKVIHKIFGKPYNKAEEEQKAAQEAQMNQIIPELGVSQAQLMEKIQKNPAAIERLQSDPQLLAKAQQNPKIIIDLLDGTYDENAPVNQANNQTAPKAPQMSPANRALINGNSAVNKTPAPAPNNQNQNQPKIQDNATYIPSSDFIAKDEYLSAEQSNEINSALARADKVLANAEKYI